MSDLALKQALLLTHGTVYGSTIDALPFQEFAEFTGSIERHNFSGFDWDEDFFLPWLANLSLFGSLTDRTPLDMDGDEMSGTAPLSILAPWEQCLLMLVRL